MLGERNVVGLCFLWHEWDWDNDSIFYLYNTYHISHSHHNFQYKYELWSLKLIELNGESKHFINLIYDEN